MLKSYKNIMPTCADSVYIDESALVIGDVTIGEQSSIWPMTVVRGDVNKIRIGARTNIQDLSVVHVNHSGQIDPEGSMTILGDDVTVGHRVVLHGCTIQDHCLIGMGSILMDHVVVESDVILGAGSLVPPGKVLTTGLWVGSPARYVRPLTPQERENIRYSANHYVKLAAEYLG